MADNDAMATITFEALGEAHADDLARGAVGSLMAAPGLSTAIESLLGPIVGAAPDAASAIAVRGRYLVEFSAAGQTALEGGAVRFMQRIDGRVQPTLVGQAGQTVENATVLGPAGRGLARAAAVGHVVVLLAVQAQLITMERSLDRIEKQLDALRRRLDQEKVALVRGRLRALQSLGEELAAASEWSREDRVRWMVALDQANTEFHQVEDLARLQCDDAARNIGSSHLNVRMFGSTGTTLVDEFRSHVQRYSQQADLVHLCLVGRMVVAHLRSGLGSAWASDELRRDVDRAWDAAAEQEKRVLDRAMDFTTKFRRAGYEVRTRKSLRDEAQSARQRSAETIAALREQLAVLSKREPKQVRALVELADGSVQSVRLLE